MRRVLLAGCLAALLAGCAKSPKNRLITEKHAENAAMADRVQDSDPAKRPSAAQMQAWLLLNAKDWESLDRYENHWKPNQRFIMVPVRETPAVAVPAKAGN